MFVRSFSNFKKKKDNFKFELLENRSTDVGTLILENKDQALSILKNKNISVNDPEFKEIVSRVKLLFKGLNYLGLLTKYKFEQDKSIREILDLLPWLKQNAGNLPKNPLEYDRFEDLKDAIVVSDNHHRVKVIYNLLPRTQKNLVKADLKQYFTNFHDVNEESPLFFNRALAIHRLGLALSFGRKLSVHKTKESLLNYMGSFIESNSEDINFEKVSLDLKSKNTKILFEDADNGIIMAEIYDYKTSNEMGSPDWCISYDKSHWKTYTQGSKKQFFLWDFSLDRSDSLFLIGFTSNGIGQITNIHDKYNKTLDKKIPNKIKDILKYTDISTDPFEYKIKMLKASENSPNDVKKVEYGIAIDDVLIFNVSSDGYDIIKSEGWESSYKPYNNLNIVRYNVYTIFDFNYPLDDPNFAIVLKIWADSDGVSNIDLMDNKGTKHTFESDDSTSMDLLKKKYGLVYKIYKEGQLKKKSYSQYSAEIKRARAEIFEGSAEMYEYDDDAVKYAKILFDYLVEEEEIELDDDEIGKEDLYKEYLIPKEDSHYDLMQYKVYSLDMVVKGDNHTAVWSIGDEDMAESSFDESNDNRFYDGNYTNYVSPEYLSNFIDGAWVAREMGDDSYYFTELIAEDPDNYDLEKTMSDHNKEELNSKIEEKDDVTQKLTNTRDLLLKSEERLQKYEDFVGDKLGKIDILQLDDLDNEDPDYQRKFNRLEVIKLKLEERSSINIKRYESLISDLEDKILDLELEYDELDTLVDEMEDEDNDEYWEISDEAIEEKAEELEANQKEDIENDPVGYISQFYGQEEIGEKLSRFVDEDKLIKSLKSDNGRGPDLAGYDHEEREHTYEDQTYFIYLQNKN
jgi:hypothetical protein